MSRDIRPLFLIALAGAAGAWMLSRTEGGYDMVAKITETVGGALSPRGIRNNNPGNIERTATTWQGMSADQGGDDRFIVFNAPVWGLRAIARIIRNYMNRGQTSVRAIINTWAPPVENDTGAYVNAVASSLGVDPDEPIDFDSHIVPLMRAIVRHENGVQPYGVAMFEQAVSLERSA